MLFLLLSSLALESELSERVSRKWKPLGHSVFYPFIMHPVSYYHCANPIPGSQESLSVPTDAGSRGGLGKNSKHKH